MTVIKRILISMFCIGTYACQADQDTIQPSILALDDPDYTTVVAAAPPVVTPFETLYRTGNFPSYSGKRTIEIRNLTEWFTFLQSEPSLPQDLINEDIDFDNSFLLAIGLGWQPSIYSIEETTVTESFGVTLITLNIYYQNCNIAPALASHYFQIIRVPTPSFISIDEVLTGGCD